MRAMFDAMLAAAVPVDAGAGLYAVVLDGAEGAAAAKRAVRLFTAENVLNVQVRAPGSPDAPLLQPRDKGTLPAVLLALIELLPRDPEALVLVTATPVAPADVVAAVGEVVDRPERIATFQTHAGPKARTFAEGLVVVVEARRLLRHIFEAAPSWSDALCDGLVDPVVRERAYRMFPAEALEPVLHAARAPRVAAQPIVQGGIQGVALD